MLTFGRGIILITLIIIPFFPIQLDMRITILVISSAIVLSPCFIQSLIKEHKKGDQTLFLWVFFLFAALISALLSIDRLSSLKIWLVFLGSFVFFQCSRVVFTQEKDKRVLAVIVIAVAVVLSLISFWNTAIRHYVNKETIGASFMWIYWGHNHLSTLILFALPICLYFYNFFKTKKYLKLILIFIMIWLVISLIITLSRGALGALVLTGIFYGLVMRKYTPKKLAIFVISTCLVLLIFLVNFKLLAGFFNAPRSGFGSGLREVYWSYSIKSGLESPIFGKGLGITSLIDYTTGPRKILSSDYSHNLFLQFFHDGGMVLLVAGIMLLFINLRKSLTKLSIYKSDSLIKTVLIAPYLVLAILAVFLNSLIDYNLQLPYIWLLFWVIMGII